MSTHDHHAGEILKSVPYGTHSIYDALAVIERSCDCAADLDHDGHVSASDLAILLGAWGPAPSCTAPDLNGSGAVDGADLAQLLGSWGSCS
jgi:hypothetical protein